MKMKKMTKRVLAIMSSMLLGLSLLLAGPCTETKADGGGLYVALGADLNQEERATVLSLLQLSEEELQNANVQIITNADEHKYLDAYLASNIIGSRALSSVVVRSAPAGHGIGVETKNITYCTTGMYQNALATAGVTDADIIVAGPFNISGTAALVGAMNAYETMTGETLDMDNIETATEELVTTSQLGEILGDQEKAEELIGAVKDVIVSEGIENPDDMRRVIEKVADQLNIKLTPEEVDQIIALMKKISALDIDVDQLQLQLKGLYDRLDSVNLSLDDIRLDIDRANGLLGKLLHFFSGIWSGLGDLLN